MVEGGRVSGKQHYRVLKGPGQNDWYVYDNWKDRAVRACPTRAEARRITNGMNGGWIADEMEEAPQADRAS
jgi:hypothetical protein